MASSLSCRFFFRTTKSLILACFFEIFSPILTSPPSPNSTFPCNSFISLVTSKIILLNASSRYSFRLAMSDSILCCVALNWGSVMFSKHHSLTTSSFTGSGGSMDFVKSEGAFKSISLAAEVEKNSLSGCRHTRWIASSAIFSNPFDGRLSVICDFTKNARKASLSSGETRIVPFIISSLNWLRITFSSASKTGLPGFI